MWVLVDLLHTLSAINPHIIHNIHEAKLMVWENSSWECTKVRVHLVLEVQLEVEIWRLHCIFLMKKIYLSNQTTSQFYSFSECFYPSGTIRRVVSSTTEEGFYEQWVNNLQWMYVPRWYIKWMGIRAETQLKMNKIWSGQGWPMS